MTEKAAKELDRSTAQVSEALYRMTEVALAAYIANPNGWNFKAVNAGVGESAARAAFAAMKELHRLIVEER